MSDPAAQDPSAPDEQPDAPQEQDLAPEPVSTTALQKLPDRSLALPDPLQRYMADVGRFPLLSPEEEKDLAIRYREYGDSQAAYRMATHNLRLVVHIAMDFRRTAHNLLDLIQEATSVCCRRCGSSTRIAVCASPPTPPSGFALTC